MRNFIFFIAIFTLLILIGGILISTMNKESSGKTQGAVVPPINYEYYWSKTCPHCTKVDEFMQGWDGRDRFLIEKFEVNESRENAIKFYQRGSFCKISKNDLGVPLLVNPDGNCLLGDEPIIQFLNKLE